MNVFICFSFCFVSWVGWGVTSYKQVNCLHVVTPYLPGELNERAFALPLFGKKKKKIVKGHLFQLISNAVFEVAFIDFGLTAKGEMGLEMTRSHLTPFSPLAIS